MGQPMMEWMPASLTQHLAIAHEDLEPPLQGVYHFLHGAYVSGSAGLHVVCEG